MEVSGGLVVAGGDAAEVLWLVEEALDQVALPIEGVVDRALDLAVAAGGDVNPAAAAFNQVDDGAGIVAAVGNRSRSGLRSSSKVGAIVLSEDFHENGRWRDPDPFFTAGGMLVGADDRRVDQLQRLRRLRCQCFKYSKPDARLRPSIEAVVDRRVWAVAFRQIAPRRRGRPFFLPFAPATGVR
jgi:hypothetical protein